jgi:hypothetical protein
MAVDVSGGADAFYELSKRLKLAGPGVRSQFHKGIREAAKPLLPAIRRQAEARFATRGGLNRHMSRGARYRVVAKTGITTAGVSIRANKTDPRTDTQGRIAHPVPGPDGKPLRRPDGSRIMVVQHFPEAVGYFRETIEQQAPAVRDELEQQLISYAEQHLSGQIRG